MKRNVLFLFTSFLLLSCGGYRELSDSDKKQIISELNDIAVLDQKYAGIPSDELKEAYGHKEAWVIFKRQRDSIGDLNQERIKKLYETYGYLGSKKIGQEAASDFWISVQHADNDIPFQQKMLMAMGREIEKGSDDKYHYAMLEDRININLNRPQRFGSQVIYNEHGQAVPRNGLVDSTAVDSLRNAYGLPPFQEYYNDMTIMHFEMNKQMFLDKGIKEPKLYE